MNVHDKIDSDRIQKLLFQSNVKDAECFVKEQQLNQARFEESHVKALGVLRLVEVHVRIMTQDNKIGIAAGNIKSLKHIETLLKNAIKSAELNDPLEKKFSFSDSSASFHQVKDIYDKEVAELRFNELLDFAKEIEQTFQATADQLHVKSAFRGTLNAGIIRRRLITTNNILVQPTETLFSYSMWGNVRTTDKIGASLGDQFVSRSLIREPVLEISRSLVEQGTMLLVPKKWEPQKDFAVIFAPGVINQLISSLFVPAISSNTINQARSPLTDKLNQQVFKETITIIDHGILEGAINSRPFDDEGTKQQETTIIENGVLRNVISDRYHAELLEIFPTGNAVRMQNGRIQISNTNLLLNDKDPIAKNGENLISSVKKGLYIGRFSGNSIAENGEFSGLAKQALLIENGELTTYVSNCALNGNLYEIMQKIHFTEEVKPFLSGIYAPYGYVQIDI